MTRVLPLPAPARMRSGPSVWATASRCWGFNPSRKSMCWGDTRILAREHRADAVRLVVLHPVFQWSSRSRRNQKCGDYHEQQHGQDEKVLIGHEHIISPVTA